MLQSNVITIKTTTNFLQTGCSSCHPINSIKSLKGLKQNFKEFRNGPNDNDALLRAVLNRGQ